MEFIEKNIDDESASNSRNKKTTRKKKSSSQFNSKSVYQFNAPPVLEKLENLMTNGERRSSIIVDEEPPSPMNETSTNRNTTTTTTTTRRKGNKSCSIKGQMKQMRRQVKEERARNSRMRSYLRRIHVQRRHIIREMRRSKCERVEIECEFAGFREYKMREIRKLTEELEAMHKEYCQVMSERDAMNKDMEALEEKVMKIEQINSQIIQHSQSNNSSYIADQIDSIAKYISRDVDLSDNQKVNANRPKYDQLEHINEQTDITDNNIEESLDEASLRQQLLECRKKRDQAILERDRALCERESIRCLCNEMRTQRDKTISELAECIRDFDELKKLRISDLKQIEYLEEKLYECEQKLIPLEQKHRDENELEHHDDEDNHVEHDSFEKDGSLNFKQNEKTLKIDFDLDDDQIDDDLGIEFVFKPAKITHSKFDPNAVVNREDSQENSAGDRGRGKVDELGQIFVSKVCKESVVFGKLKEYDQILKVNDNDVQFVSVLEFDELINNLNRSNQFVVRREYIHSEPTVNGNNVLIESSKCSMASDISYLEYLRKYQNGANSQQFDSDEDEEEEDNEEEEEIDEEELEDEEEKHENESTTSEEKNVPALEHSPSFIINNSSDNSINTASSRSDNTTNHKTTNISNNKTKKTNHRKDFKHLKIYNKKTLNSKKYH